MLTSEAIKVVEARFRSGEIPKEELLLHVEPMLEGLARDRAEHEEVRRLVNAIEVAIYTEPDVRLRDAVAARLGRAVRVRDGAGEVRSVAHGPAGDVRTTERQLRVDLDDTPGAGGRSRPRC